MLRLWVPDYQEVLILYSALCRTYSQRIKLKFFTGKRLKTKTILYCTKMKKLFIIFSHISI